MKYTLIFLALITLHLSSFSQNKKKRALPPPPPPVKEIVDLYPDTLSLQEYSSPKLFEWKMNADITLKPGTVFKELIKLTYGVSEVNGFYSQEPLTLKKSKAGRAAMEAKVPKMITSINYYDTTIANGIITLKERGRLVMALKIIYAKSREVTSLKDINSGAVYEAVASDEMPVAVPVTN